MSIETIKRKDLTASIFLTNLVKDSRARVDKNQSYTKTMKISLNFIFPTFDPLIYYANLSSEYNYILKVNYLCHFLYNIKYQGEVALSFVGALTLGDLI